MRMGIGIGLGNTIGASGSRGWTPQDWGNNFAQIGQSQIIFLSADADIRNTAPDINRGGAITLITGEINTAINDIFRVLVSFDLTTIHPNASFTEVKLLLYRNTNRADNTRNIQVYRMKRAWVEGTKNGTGAPDGVTWNTYDGINAWTSPGGFDPADCEQTPIAETSIPHDMGNGWVTIIIPATNKEELNGLGFGWLIKMETESNDGHIFTSTEGTSAQRPRLEVTIKDESKTVNGSVSPLFERSESNPLFAGAFGSVVYEIDGSMSIYYCKILDSKIFKRTSTDGITWSVEVTVLDSGVGKATEVALAWREDGTYYVLYRSNEYSANKDICLATSVDGITWTKSLSNPVITQADVGAWASGDIDPWGIIKVGDTYHLWVNDVNEVPRQTGQCTSTDLVNWTPNVNNPIFDNGRYCVDPIKYKDKYYLFVCYSPSGASDSAHPTRHRIEVYRDDSPTFLPDSREYLGNILLGGEIGEWDIKYLDTPSSLTKTVQRDSFPEDDKLSIYYSAIDEGWAMGLCAYDIRMFEYLDTIEEMPIGQ